MTDHGSQFDSADYKHFAEQCGFNQLFSASYHHPTNGVVERFNRTLEAQIRATALQSNRWDEVVDSVLLSYRTTVHKTTRKSPYEVVFAAQPRLPIDTQLSLATPNSSVDRRMIHQQVNDAVALEASSSKKRYDAKRKVKERSLHGKKVYWQNVQPNPKQGKHLAPRFKGPFMAERTDSKWNYRIVDRDGSSKVIHVDQLKECLSDEPLAPGL